MKRKDFLKKAAALSFAVPVLLQGRAATFPSESKKQLTIPKKNKERMTIAMWDFSWLTDQGKGGSFEPIEQRVAEAAERGYNTLRIDCFPSRILEKNTYFRRGYNPGEGDILPCWGRVTTEFSCNPLQKLKQLADACRKHNIWLGLDSWEKGHMMGHQQSPLVLDDDRSIIPVSQEENALRDFAHTWTKALRIMREEGILERAVWVAPMNEVPHFASRSLESIRNISAHNKNEGGVRMDRNRLFNERLKLVNQWMGEEIKEEIQRENIPLSYSSLGAEEYASLLPEIYDMVDVHFMPDVIRDQQEAAQLAALTQGVSIEYSFQGYEKIDLKRYSELWDEACRNHYAAMLKRTHRYLVSALEHVTFPTGKRMQAVITESFGPCFWPDHPDVQWEWYKQYNGDSARIAASMPFDGISLSNYAEPLFSLWDDIDWHRNSNIFILTTPPQGS